MMACTPSALRSGKAPEVVESGRVVSLPEIKSPSLSTDSVTLPALLDSIGVANVEADIDAASVSEAVEALTADTD